MFSSYFKIAFRNIRRHKVYSIINIVGLAVGMACAIFILMWVQYEFSFDRYHENAARIYRLTSNFNFGTFKGPYAVSNHPAGPTLQRDYPEVEKAVRFHAVWGQSLVQHKDKKNFEHGLFYADDTVFDVFSFPLIKGDSKSALTTAYSVVITEDMAKKYFDSEDPIGQTIKISNIEHSNLENESNFRVTGVLKNVQSNSHFSFNMLLSFETIYHDNEKQRDKWTGDLNNYTYLLLAPNIDHKELEKKFPILVDNHLKQEFKDIGAGMDFFLQPLTDIHLRSKLKADFSYKIDILVVYAFLTIAGLVLIIACINFINLTTARSAGRAREVGVRKALGAARSKLITQLMIESFVLSVVALILALGLVEIFLPLFRSLFESDISFEYVSKPAMIAGFIGLAVFVGLIAGIYPAIFLSAFHPVNTLKDAFGKGYRNARFRSLLVVVQFTIAIVMIIGSVIIFNQFRYMNNKTLGFDKEQVVVLKIVDNSIKGSIESIKAELNSHSSIAGVAFTSHPPGMGGRANVFKPQGYSYEQMQMMDAVSVDSDFMSVMGIEVVAGRNFSRDFVDDRHQAVLINETAAKQFGWDEAVGRTITELDDKMPTKTIVGVVKDFHIRSLYNPIEPLYIENEAEKFNLVMIKIRPDNVSEAMQFLEKKWKKIDSSQMFDYWFLDEEFDRLYRDVKRLSTIFSYFTLLAIVIACLGLFGLASFTAEQRTREIGIRKALGASVPDVLIMLSKTFIKWVLVANIIAWPIAYYISNDWLEDYPYRINMNLGVFVIAGFLALVIALLTVSWQAVKSARANPVDALRYE